MTDRNERHDEVEAAVPVLSPALERVRGLALTPFDGPWTTWACAVAGRLPAADERGDDEPQ